MPEQQVNQPLDFWMQGIGSFGRLKNNDNAIGGNYTISGSGQLTMTGKSTYTGATTISAGTVTLSSSGALNNTKLLTIGAG